MEILAQEWIQEGTAIKLYLTYIGIAVLLVTVLARMLYKHGAAYLKEVFENDQLAESTNKLLVIGFCLLNLGYSLILFRFNASDITMSEALNELFTKIGLLTFSLGIIHLINMYVFWSIRKSAKKSSQIEQNISLRQQQYEFATAASQDPGFQQP